MELETGAWGGWGEGCGTEHSLRVIVQVCTLWSSVSIAYSITTVKGDNEARRTPKTKMKKLGINGDTDKRPQPRDTCCHPYRRLFASTHGITRATRRWCHNVYTCACRGVQCSARKEEESTSRRLVPPTSVNPSSKENGLSSEAAVSTWTTRYRCRKPTAWLIR